MQATQYKHTPTSDAKDTHTHTTAHTASLIHVTGGVDSVAHIIIANTQSQLNRDCCFHSFIALFCFCMTISPGVIDSHYCAIRDR